MLRLLEYHDGVVFLTTNRIQHFDPAVLSRVTISIAFNDLSPAERERVWRLLLASSGVDEGGIRVADMARRFSMNGRSIKNALRLAMSLAAEQGAPLSNDLLLRVVRAVQKGMHGSGEQLAPPGPGEAAADASTGGCGGGGSSSGGGGAGGVAQHLSLTLSSDRMLRIELSMVMAAGLCALALTGLAAGLALRRS
jgi:uncharacterized membrane protein YgcG